MRVPLPAILVVLLALPAGAEPAAGSVVPAVLEAFGRLGLEAEDVRVHDVEFWKRYAPRLIEGGRMLPTARLPGERDGLRPALVDRALRSPLEAVRLAVDLCAEAGPRPLGPLLGDVAGGEPSLGEDPIPAGAAVHANVRWLACGLAGLEDAVVAALPEGPPDPRLQRWMVEGVEADEVADARVALDPFAAVDLEPVVRQVLAFRRAICARADSAEGFQVGDPVRVETPRGLVVVGSPEPDVHAGDAWLLVDPGGDDVYRGNAGGTGTTRRSALCLDLGGDDHYVSTEPFSQGAAFHGVGLLIDEEGDDRYEGGAFNQAATIGGVSLLADRLGEDVFEATEFAQGAAALGYALLASGAGDDRFTLDQLGQGLGRTAGYGVLHDTAGDDRYVARPTHESMYSQWTNGRTVHWSFAQGCGFGHYARYEETGPDGSKSLVIRDLIPGGVGALVDGAGDDTYEGSMYAQGTGYFQGLGICADLAGNDTYTATWYGQGAAPHFAVGILVDGGGDDRYTGMHQVQGNGRDFSTGVLVDLGGDDRYVGEDRVQGCGDRRDGYGVFVDVGGSDRYDAKRPAARGWATMVKPEEQPTEETPWADWGVFLDLGGEDVYAGKAQGADGTSWKQAATGRGLGVDR